MKILHVAIDEKLQIKLRKMAIDNGLTLAKMIEKMIKER
jgi:hypothetical protein